MRLSGSGKFGQIRVSGSTLTGYHGLSLYQDQFSSTESVTLTSNRITGTGQGTLLNTLGLAQLRWFDVRNNELYGATRGGRRSA